MSDRHRTWSKRAQRVREAWAERLMTMVADATGEDYGDVAELIAASENEP